jgi:hypothetical protein
LLVLEGQDAYDTSFPTPSDAQFRDDFLNEQPKGTVLGDIVRAGGVQGMITSKPIDPATLAQYESDLTNQFGDFAATQGLRFRSSNQVEDAENFQGVGVGLSFTGYLHADEFPPTSPHHAETIESSIKQVWATYWRAEGFEERKLANIDQLSSNMGITVHAKSDNSSELANGDLFCSLDPPENVDDAFTMALDVQPGANPSVTNPNGSTDLPEHDVVHRLRSDGSIKIDRVQHATLVPDAFVLSDDDLDTLFDQCTRVAQYYFDTENTGVIPSQQRRLLTLDMEFRKMAAGWPALASGPNPQPERLIFRQSASVFPSIARVPSTVKAMPIPLDVLNHSQRVEKRSCTSASFVLNEIDVFTNPAIDPDLGYALSPFTAAVAIDEGTDHLSADHTQFTATHPGMSTGGEWDIDLTTTTSVGFTHFASDGSHITVDDVTESATCTRSVLYATPDDFLKDIIASSKQ